MKFDKETPLLIVTRTSALVKELQNIYHSLCNCICDENFIIWHILVDCNRCKLTDINHIFIDSIKNKWNGNIYVHVTYTHSNSEWYGYNLCNEALYHPSNQTCKYVYLLDDDTILHPNFNELLSELQTRGDEDVYVFNQIRKNENDLYIVKPDYSLSKENVLGWIDAGQFITRIDALKNIGGWVLHYCGDGLTLRELLSIHNPIIIDITASYYNYITEIA